MFMHVADNPCNLRDPVGNCGGCDLEMTNPHTDLYYADRILDHARLGDAAKDGAFARAVGESASGVAGLTLPASGAALSYYRVGAATLCADGPK